MALPFLYSISLLLHGYIGWRLLPALAGFSAVGVAAVLVLSALLMPLGLVARRVVRPPLADTLAWMGLLCMGLFSSLFVLTVLRDVVLLAFALAHTLGATWTQQVLPALRVDSAVEPSSSFSVKCTSTALLLCTDLDMQIARLF